VNNLGGVSPLELGAITAVVVEKLGMRLVVVKIMGQVG